MKEGKGKHKVWCEEETHRRRYRDALRGRDQNRKVVTWLLRGALHEGHRSFMARK